jgi:isoleucyl-tRNA synthetase
VAGGVTLEPGEFVLQLQPKDGITAAALSTNDVVLVLDTEVTPELEAEGVARDFVRLVQQARKDAGLHVSDRIRLTVEVDSVTTAALEAHRAYIEEQVLASEFVFGAAGHGSFTASGKVGSDGTAVQLSVAAV